MMNSTTLINILNNHSDYTQACLAVRKHGEYLASGAYSQAFALDLGEDEPAIYAVKLGGYVQPDSGGQLYAEWCLDHQHLTAVPKILYYKEFYAGLYIIIMELLDDHDCSTEFDAWATYIENYEDSPFSPVVPGYITEFCEDFKEVRAIAQMDLHAGNYMLREYTGDMVVIDPFSVAF
jgi:hypothetical protein